MCTLKLSVFDLFLRVVTFAAPYQPNPPKKITKKNGKSKKLMNLVINSIKKLFMKNLDNII